MTGNFFLQEYATPSSAIVDSLQQMKATISPSATLAADAIAALRKDVARMAGQVCAKDVAQMAAAIGEQVRTIKRELAAQGRYALQEAMRQAAAGLTPSAASLAAPTFPQRQRTKANDDLTSWPASITLSE